ncbi:MAG: PilZ domain-containing protein [Sulfuricaulis sp.]|uniref:PilZ domain-containing protein n=1 Tax=Sulfuricaulis sp. TaxID=2003553 RepID=UPI003C61535B
MNAEQRSSIRKAISLNIVINYDMAYSRRWKVRDLGLNGAKVEMRRDELLQGTPVEAVLVLTEHGEYGLHRMPAEVVRTDRNGVALRFRNYDDRAYTALVNLLYSA